MGDLLQKTMNKMNQKIKIFIKHLFISYKYGWIHDFLTTIVGFILWVFICVGVPFLFLLIALGIGRLTGWF